MSLKLIIIVITLGLGIFLRFYKLGDIPPGLNPDEASIGYNAYSLLETGKDRYGQFLPLLFRSLGTYLLPVYTYLTTIPVALFGLTVFSIHFISALSSSLIILLTLLIVFEIKKINLTSKFLAVLFISISPWAIYFGRAGHEVTLSLAFFVLSIFLFIKSISHPKLMPLTLLMVGLSSYTYYAERYLNLIFFPLLIFIFKDKFIQNKKYLTVGLVLLAISQLPQLSLIGTEAFSRRIEQVNYWNDKTSNDLMAKPRYLLVEFSSHYLEYFSPRSLFFDPDPQQARSIPNLSVFYLWMILPFFFGIKIFIKNKSDPVSKILLLLLIVGPMPAALTKDPFYSFRVLSFLWVLTILIALGSGYLLELISKKIAKITLILGLVIFSLVCLYSSYFVLLKYERGDNYGYQYHKLIDKLSEHPDKKIVIDASRVPAAHVWIPFYGKIDPRKYQSQIDEQIKSNYYNNTSLDSQTKIDNLEIRSILWMEDIYEDIVLVGDKLSISDEQIKEHKLEPFFQIIGMDGETKLLAYRTNPKKKCEDFIKKGLQNSKCKSFSY